LKSLFHTSSMRFQRKVRWIILHSVKWGAKACFIEIFNNSFIYILFNLSQALLNLLLKNTGSNECFYARNRTKAWCSSGVDGALSNMGKSLFDLLNSGTDIASGRAWFYTHYHIKEPKRSFMSPTCLLHQRFRPAIVPNLLDPHIIL